MFRRILSTIGDKQGHGFSLKNMLVTFLGHQGWAFESEESFILLDPIKRKMGNGNVRLPVWPNRNLDFDLLPDIDGLILSHEHSDHFDLETLIKLPFRGDVFVSDLSSCSMRNTLISLGFNIKTMHPYQVFNINNISFTPLGMLDEPLEYGVYGLLVEDNNGHSFLTTIDGVPHPSMNDWLYQNCPTRNLDNYTNNFVETLPYLSNVKGNPEHSFGQAVSRLIDYVEEFKPSNICFSGQGWSFPESHKELNSEFFSVTNKMLLDATNLLFPFISASNSKPGQVYDLGNLNNYSYANYVHTEQVTARRYEPNENLKKPLPWSRNNALEESKLNAVVQFIISEFAILLDKHAPKIMHGLYELSTAQCDSYDPHILLRVLNSGQNLDFVLDHGQLRFVPIKMTTNPGLTYCAGIEVWASDFYSIINGDDEAYLIYESSVRRWCHFPDLLGEPICIEFFSPFTPRHRPFFYQMAYEKRMKNLLQETASSVKRA